MGIFDSIKSRLSFDKNKKGIVNDVVLALDIGTEYVKAVIFTSKNGRIKIIGYGRSRQQVGAMKGAMVTNLQAVMENCDLAVGDAVRDLEESQFPSKMMMGIAGELVKGEVIIANYIRKNPEVKITKQEISDVINEVKEKTFQSSINDIAEKVSIDPDEISEIDSVVNNTYIGDYRVVNPVGFSGEHISFRIFSSFAPKIHIESLRTIANYMGLELLKIVVVPYAIARGYSSSSSDAFSAIFIDVGGGTTDIALIDSGAIIGTQMFAMGGKLFTKRAETILGVPNDIAETKKILYSKVRDPKINLARYVDMEQSIMLTKTDQYKLQKAFEKDAKVWVSGVEMALSEFEEAESYPSKFMLCGGGSQLPEIVEALRNHPWLDVLPFDRFPMPEMIRPKDISSVDDVFGLLKEVDDVAVVSIARMYLEL